MTEKVIKPILDFFQINKGRQATFAKGINGSLSAGICVSAAAGYTYDYEGNIGVILTIAAGGGTPNASLSLFENSTSAPIIYDQRGPSFQTGSSVSAFGGGFGYEYSSFKNTATGNVYYGNSALGGIGAPVPGEIHAEAAYTFVFGFNAVKQLESLYICIMEW